MLCYAEYVNPQEIYEHQIDIQRYERMLHCYIVVADQIKNFDQRTMQQLSDTEKQFIDGSSKKLLSHALTALNIAREPEILLSKSDMSFNEPDDTSLLVIARATLETYSTLYLSVFHPDVELRNLMEKFFKFDSLKWRIDLNTFDDADSDKQSNDTKIVDKLDTERTTLASTLLAKNPHYQNYDKKYKQLNLSGIGKNSVSHIYSSLSQHAHGNYLASLQVAQATEIDSRDRIRFGLSVIGMSLALTLKALGTRFIYIQRILENEPSLINTILFHIFLANASDFGERKGLFFNIDSGNFKIISWIGSYNPNDHHPTAIPFEYKTLGQFDNFNEAQLSFKDILGVEEFFVDCNEIGEYKQVLSWT